MESQSDLRFTQHEITDWVVKFAASRPNDWFAASHVARNLNLPVDGVRETLKDMTKYWLEPWVHYECPDHDFTLLRSRADEAVDPNLFVTCTGDAVEEGHEVHPSLEHAMLVFQAAERLIEYAKKGVGSR